MLRTPAARADPFNPTEFLMSILATPSIISVAPSTISPARMYEVAGSKNSIGKGILAMEILLIAIYVGTCTIIVWNQPLITRCGMWVARIKNDLI
ncbi:MAG: hypothetical protein QXS27_00400 [Candidatus Jordarchaeaceae archaeon]